MSTCEMKVAAAKAAAAAKFKAAAALQLKVKELTRKIEEVNEGKNDSDAVVTASHINTTTASTPTPMKATTTTNTNILKSERRSKESCNRSIRCRQKMRTIEKTTIPSTCRRNQELPAKKLTRAVKTRVRLSCLMDDYPFFPGIGLNPFRLYIILHIQKHIT